MASTTQFQEGQSIQRPPLFDGSNYTYWKCRMRIFLQSLNYELWNIVETPYQKPTTSYTEWTLDERTSANLDAKAMNALFCALDMNEFNRVSTSTSAHQIWHNLEEEWEKKITAIEESHDLSTLKLENLVGNLMAFEVQPQDKWEVVHSKKKLLAFNASSDTDTTVNSDNDEDVDTLSKEFRKFLIQSKYKDIIDTNNSYICYKCNKAGHLKKDCPLLKNKFKKKKKKNKKKALQDDYASSSSENEETDKETTNICGMAQLNYISSYMNVRNDNDYFYSNNWKPNSKWVWISKD
jgi:hypothetical protein